MYRFMVQATVVLFCHMSLLGMKYNDNQKLAIVKKSTIHKKFDDNELRKAFESANLPIEMIESAAACAHDTDKDAMKKTCKYFNFVVSPKNIDFVSHPLFTASERMIHKMVIFNGWYNNVCMLNALRKHLHNDTVTIPNFTECDRYGTGITGGDKKIAVGYFATLRFPTTKQEVDLAMYCAALCDDTVAIKNLASKITALYGQTHGYGRNEVQKELMMLLAKRGNKEAFEFMIVNDPYRVRAYHNSGQHYYEKTLLDNLDNSNNEEMNIYKTICKQHGEKTCKDVTPSACIIL